MPDLNDKLTDAPSHRRRYTASTGSIAKSVILAYVAGQIGAHLTGISLLENLVFTSAVGVMAAQLICIYRQEP